MNIGNSNYSTLLNNQRMVRGLQKELGDRQRELSTGRKSDMSLQIGSLLRQSINMRAITGSLNTYLSNNQVYLLRLENTQSILSDISLNANEFKSSLLQTLNGDSNINLIVNKSRNFLNQLIQSLNISINNKFVFGGDNLDTTPVKAYFKEIPSQAKSYVDTIFLSDPPNGFGFSQASSLVSNISPDQLNNFINGPISDLFSEEGWSINWSTATKEPSKNQISSNHHIELSVTSNDPALRKIAMAYVMMNDLGAEKMNVVSYKTLAERAAAILDDGIRLITATQARVGYAQQSVGRENQLMRSQTEILNIRIGGLENADQNEVATHISNLLALIETNYSLTARISKLSLSRYL